MFRKIIVFIIGFTLFSTFSLGVISTNSPYNYNINVIDDPEIEDDIGDPWGILINRPLLFNILVKLGFFDEHAIDAIDIESGDISEDISQPGILFMTIKVKDLEFLRQATYYSFRWLFNNQTWATRVFTRNQGEMIDCILGIFDDDVFYDLTCSFDFENESIILEVPKEYLGNILPGDKLTHLHVITKMQSPFSIFDLRNFAEDDAYGGDYTIQW